MPSNPQARRASCVGAAFGRQPDLAHLPSSGQAAEREVPGASREQRSSLLLQSKINKTPLGEMWISGAGHFALARKHARAFLSKPDLPGVFPCVAGSPLCFRFENVRTAFSCRCRKNSGINT